ncbi:MAG: hypothetical protein LBG81_09020 [Coriobacteriaceae bacterium]|jgi:hypothetical protein|nr:hypothetical protein [Coriobacteriaceae bacterium]
MPGLLDHIAFLSQDVGLRPAGTEEEQQAALYITEQLQREAGLSALIEDFNSAANEETPKAVCAFLSLIVTVLALFLPVVEIPALLISIITAILYTLEAYDHPVITKFLKRGISQNVVARYEPTYSPEAGGMRRRKIVIMAHYDSGKVRFELNTPLVHILPTLQKVSLWSMIFVPSFMLIRYLLFLHADGILLIVLNVIVGIALVFVALPALFAFIHRFSAYSEAANCNASGVAVLLELARRIGRSKVGLPRAALDVEGGAVAIFGEEAARSAGLVPEGARLVYEATHVRPPEPLPQTEEERLAAAKAAIAALTGKPVPHRPQASVAESLVQAKDASRAAWLSEEERELWGYDPAASAGTSNELLTAAPLGPTGISGAAGAVVGTAIGMGADVAAGQGIATVVGSAGAASAAIAGGAAVAAGAAAGANGMPANTEEDAGAEDSNVPEWFKKAQEKAKKATGSQAVDVQRSRYADALDAAVAESSTHFNHANRATGAVDSETDDRIRMLQKNIMEAGTSLHSQQRHDIPGISPSSSGEGESTLSMPPLDTSGLSAASLHSETAPLVGLTAGQSATFLAGAIPPIGSPAASGGQPSPREDEKRPIPLSLPDVVASPALPPLDRTAMQQRAPLAATEGPSQLATKGLVTALPSIGMTDERYDGSAPVGGHASAGRPLGQAMLAGAGTEVRMASATHRGQGHQGAEAQTAAQRATGTRFPEGLPDLEEASLATAPPFGTYPSDLEPPESHRDLRGLAGKRSATPGGESQSDRASLKDMLPSLSGPFNEGLPSRSGHTVGKASVNVAASFVPAGATGAFAPVGNEILANVHPDEIYVDDVDDSAYEEGFTETGAFAGPGYVDMPRSRIKRIFGKLRKDKKEEVSTQEWLNVDKGFDARSAGAARGSWKSFRQDDDSYDDAYGNDRDIPMMSDTGKGSGKARRAKTRQQYDYDEDDWNGGAFSKSRMSDDAFGADYAEGLESQDAVLHYHGREEQGAMQTSPYGSADYDNTAWEDQHSGDLALINQFRSPGLNTEIWFVALGSELSNNEGARAFLSEHEQDLRGSVVINLCALGCGNLSFLDKEGSGKEGVTSRMKRYVAKAAQATRTTISPATIRWKNSAATVLSKRGLQVLSIVGMDGAKPARFAQADDVIDAIDEDILYANTDFVMELLKNI